MPSVAETPGPIVRQLTIAVVTQRAASAFAPSLVTPAILATAIAEKFTGVINRLAGFSQAAVRSLPSRSTVARRSK